MSDMSSSRPTPSPHIVVVGNQKGGSGKSTVAMHVTVALLKAGKRVICFDLDLHQQTLSRYIENRREWAQEVGLSLEIPDQCPMTEEGADWFERDYAVDLARFMSHLQTIEHDRNYDFIVVDTPGGLDNLSVVAHGLADTLITPINDSLVDLDVIVTIGRKHSEPQPSQYARVVARALAARRNACGLETDWVVVRNRISKLPSRNQRQVEKVLECVREQLGFRTVRGLSERPVFREYFAAGLTALDPIDLPFGAKPSSSNLIARLEVRELIEKIGLVENPPLPEPILPEPSEESAGPEGGEDEAMLRFAPPDVRSARARTLQSRRSTRSRRKESR